MINILVSVCVLALLAWTALVITMVIDVIRGWRKG